MPHVNCCVRECAATTRRNPNLCFYALPVPKEERETWMLLIQNTCTFARRTTGVCSLHFAGGHRSHMNVVPTIFPWSPEWPAVIEDYNSKLVNEIGPLDEQGSLKKMNKGPFLLPIRVPVQEGERVDGGAHNKLPSVLYFRSQHADQWTRFHQKTPVLSCLGGHTEIQKAQEPSISPSSPSSCTSQKTDDTPDETLPSVKKEDGDGRDDSSTDDNDETGVEDEDPMSLLLTGKARQLMEVLQVYRKNTIPTASEEQQESSDSREWKLNWGMGEELLSKPNCVSTADKNWAAANHNTFSGEGERSLPLQDHQTITIEGVTYASLPLQDHRTITIEGVTYTSVFKSSEEDILEKYIIKTSSRLNLKDICRKVYKFCMACGIEAPPEWRKKRAADVRWVTGFFRRHPSICKYYETQDVAKTHHYCDYTYYDRYTTGGVRIPVLLVNHNKKKVNHTSTVFDEHNYSVKLI